VLALLSIGASLAFAQSPNDFDRLFGSPQDPMAQAAAQSEWNRLTSGEVGCIDDALQQQGGSVDALIQRGVMPSDARIRSASSRCRSELTQSGPVPVYVVSGLALGTRIRFDSSAYREYRCGPSDQINGFTWCKKTRRGKERRGSFNVTQSILHSPDGRIAYVNRYQAPAFFSPTEAEEDIERYSRQIGERPRVIAMPPRPEVPHGILAAWGKVVLEPLDIESLKTLAEGKRPTTKGYLIDFIGNFARSAKEGLPVYRLGGGAGFVWVASHDKKGRGILRFAAVDTSAMSSLVAESPTNSSDQGLQVSPQNLQFLMKGLRTADNFVRFAEETFAAVFNDVEGDEFENGIFNSAREKSPSHVSKSQRETAFQNFRECFFLSDLGCNRSYGMLSGVMPALSPALREVIEQPEAIREFKYEGACFFSVTLDVKKSLLQKNADGSYLRDQTGHVAYFLNFNGIDPNSVKIIDASEYIRIAFEPPRTSLDRSSSANSPESTNGQSASPQWQARYERFISSMIEATSIKKFVLLEKKKVDRFPSAPVSLLLADLGESTDEEHDWKPIDYFEEKYPFAIKRSSLRRFPVLAFGSGDADLIAESVNGVIQSCQNDR
jgi:hypothetical protein